MDPIEIILKAFSALVNLIVIIVERLLPAMARGRGLIPNRTLASPPNTNILQHTKEVSAWCKQHQIHGLPEPKTICDASIALALSNAVRKFSGTGANATMVDLDLLNGENSYVVLGDPGSGKTTTLKRLANHVIQSPTSTQFKYPLVIRLRELPHRSLIARQSKRQSWQLLKRIARVFGFEYTDSYEQDEAGAVVEIHTRICNTDISKAIPAILNQTRAIVLLDGLDELNPNEAGSILDEIQVLLDCAECYKVIATCRSGEFLRTFRGSHLVEIQPLDRSQIRTIATAWVEDVDQFIVDLDHTPYHDIANRPLLLCQLLFVYRNYGRLPERAALAYRKSVDALLEEWDANNQIRRVSNYAGFTPDKKREFLIDVAHEITCQVKRATFHESDLIRAYTRICTKHSLPAQQATEVVREIESHTGIIVSAGLDAYEFAHLSLQEYLAAEYISRSPLTPSIRIYLKEYPAVIAVAVGLTTDPSEWLTRLVFDEGLTREFTDSALLKFFRRLRLEKPLFSRSAMLGCAMLTLLARYYNDTNDDLRQEFNLIIRTEPIFTSITDALKLYSFDDGKRMGGYYSNSGVLKVSRTEADESRIIEYQVETKTQVPFELFLDRRLIGTLLQERSMILPIGNREKRDRFRQFSDQNSGLEEWPESD